MVTEDTELGQPTERVHALVSDVAGEPGGLPLLSTTLLELWRARAGRALPTTATKPAVACAARSQGWPKTPTKW
jgi:hypothetical protein